MTGFRNAMASAGSYANNLQFALDRYSDNHTNTTSLNFYRPDALPDAQQCQSTEGINKNKRKTRNKTL